MAFISVTRLRLRSVRYLPAFLWNTFRINRQTVRSQGFLAGSLLRDAKWTFWTQTVWNDKAAMQAYRNSGAHKKSMAHFPTWCDEGSVVHWEQDMAALVDWSEAHRRMKQEGRQSRVNHPSPDHQSRRIPPPEADAKMAQTALKPKAQK